jgi:hypothetical protein
VGIETPSNAVELDIGTGDLAKEVDSQEVETLDWVGTDGGEVPVPHDLGAGVQDVESLDALLRVLGHLCDPLSGGGSGRSAVELRECK